MYRVLIVDDAAFMRMTLKLMLERNGFEVIAEAENGAVGVRKYMEYHPDLVTMDITMPEMDGIEALKKIKEYDPKAKVVMLSALGQEVFIKEAILIGASHFIVKPFKEDHVIETLNKIIADTEITG
jgi:two-component system chemotaxis response regulator CheY